VLVFGLVLCIGSLAGVMVLYTWASWDWHRDRDVGRPVSYRRPVSYVPPRYLLMGGIGAIVGLLLIAASQSG
jgi:hypothetical protein